MSEEKIINELTKIKGLSKKQAIKLYRAGIKSIKNLGSSNPEELTKVTGISKKQLTTWIILARAQERKKFIEVDAAAEEISQLIEIKIDDAKRLVSAGVMSIDDLADESSDLLSEDTGLAVETINKWIKKAKEVKKLPPEKRKVVIVPSTEISFGSKLSGAFLGTSSGFNNIYSDSSSFGQSFIFVLITSIFLWFYLSTSKAVIGDWSITTLWEMTQFSIVFEIAGLEITFYPIVFVGGIAILTLLWLLFGKAISSLRKLEFKGISAVLGFSMAPGILLAIIIIGRFIPIMHFGLLELGEQTLYFLTVLLIIFSAWVALVFIRGLFFSPKEKIALGNSTINTKSTFKTANTTEVIEVIEEKEKPIEEAEAVSIEKAGPINLADFGNIIDSEALDALQKVGFNTSIDLLRAKSKDIALKTGIQQSKVIIWRIISDLLRIPGINLESALILTKSGVRSCKHLSKINENALKVQVLDTISKENITTSITAQMLSDWIKKAKYI